jgi:serine/threonine-protein kinase HipA
MGGLRAAEAVTGAAGGRTYLLVTRYDRRQRDGRWLRLHQEDFCQALGKPPGAKYQRNQTGVGGPGSRTSSR